MNPIFTLLRFVLLYIAIIFGSMFISYKTNKKFEKSIAPYFGIIIIGLFIFGLFNGLKYGVWILTTASIVLGLYALIKDRKNIKDKMLTPGLVFFTLAFFVMMLTSYNKNLTDYDHYFYRSLNTKNMYYFDTMSKGFLNLYPPATNLIQYFFMKVMGVYIQGIESLSIQMVGFALLLPLFDRKNKNGFVAFIVTMIVICMPSILANLIFYESAYPDALLGLIIGYCVYMLCSESDNKFKVFSVSLMLSVMTLTKPIGFVISGLVIGMYLLVSLMNQKCNNKASFKNFFKSKEFKNICILILVVVITMVSWKIFVKINNKYNDSTERSQWTREAENPLAFLAKTTLTTTFGYYDGGDHDAADSNGTLITKIYSLVTVMGPVKMTLFGAIAVIMIASVLVYKYVVKDENKKVYANYIIALTVGLILYIIALQLCYILKFSTEEMLDHAGLNRYLPTFMLGMIYFIVAMTLNNMEEKKDRRVNYILLLVIIMSFTFFQPIFDSTITSGTYNIYSMEYTNNGRVYARNIDKVIGENDEIVVISQDEDTNLYNYMVRYYLYPEHKAYAYNGVTSERINEIKNLIINNRIPYIFVYSADSNLNSLTDNRTYLKDKTLYKVNINLDNTISLQEQSMG